jgi:hypothetical protein
VAEVHSPGPHDAAGELMELDEMKTWAYETGSLR